MLNGEFRVKCKNEKKKEAPEMCAQNAGIASGNAKNSENIGNAHLIGGKCNPSRPTDDAAATVSATPTLGRGREGGGGRGRTVYS